jgi:HPt (histidine-containing phosphotransfer) domain-containing protein
MPVVSIQCDGQKDRSVSETLTQPDTSHGQTTLLPLIDVLAMEQWCNDLDMSDVRDILGKVPAEAEQCMALLSDALTQRDLSMARRAAHRLKGMAANLGAARLAYLAKDIEVTAKEAADASLRLPALKVTLDETLAAFASFSSR